MAQRPFDTALPLRKASVLIIDDFQGIRTMLRDFVKSMGVQSIDTAGNGRDAIALLAAHRYDVVLCDYNLGPGANGQQVLEEARARNLIGVATVWIMVTAETTPEMVAGAAEVRPDDYLLKPVNQAVLQSRLERLLARKQMLAPVEAAVKALNYPAAIAACDAQLQARVANPQDILRLKGELLLGMGDLDGAAALYQSVLALRAVPWAQTGLGKVVFQQRNFSQARASFEHVLRENGVFMEASDWLARTHRVLGNTREAERVLREAVKVSPHSPRRQRMLGDTAYRNGSLEVAQTAFQKGIRAGQFSAHHSVTAYTGLSRVLADQHAPNEALQTLAQGRKAFADQAEALLLTAAAEGAVYGKLGDGNRAAQALAESQRLLAQLEGQLKPDLLVELATSLFQMGRPQDASELLKKVVRNHHDNPEITAGVEGLFRARGMADEGRALIAECCGEVVDINNQGVTLAKQGELQAGAALLRNAALQLPNNEVVLINLCGLLIGQLSREGPNPEIAHEAGALLERVRQLNLGNKHYHQYSAVLRRLRGAG